MFDRVILSITNRCNLRCLHCYAEAGEGESGELSGEELDEITMQIARLPTQQLVISGGEPLVAPERLERVARQAAARRVPTTVTTNGTLLTAANVRWLKSLGIRTVQISIDGDRPEEHDFIRGHGAFRRALTGARTAIGQGLRCVIMMVAFKHNWSRLRPMARLAQELGAEILGVDRFVPVGRGVGGSSLILEPDDLRGLYDELHQAQGEVGIPIRFNDPVWNALQLEQTGLSDFGWARSAPLGCTAGTRSLVVAADGEVYPCTFMPNSLGNLRQQSLQKVLEASGVLADLLDRDRLEGKCQTCRRLYVCGGCRAEAMLRFGNYLAEDPTCVCCARVER